MSSFLFVVIIIVINFRVESYLGWECVYVWYT